MEQNKEEIRIDSNTQGNFMYDKSGISKQQIKDGLFYKSQGEWAKVETLIPDGS